LTPPPPPLPPLPPLPPPPQRQRRQRQRQQRQRRLRRRRQQRRRRQRQRRGRRRRRQRAMLRPKLRLHSERQTPGSRYRINAPTFLFTSPTPRTDVPIFKNSTRLRPADTLTTSVDLLSIALNWPIVKKQGLATTIRYSTTSQNLAKTTCLCNLISSVSARLKGFYPFPSDYDRYVRRFGFRQSDKLGRACGGRVEVDRGNR